MGKTNAPIERERKCREEGISLKPLFHAFSFRWHRSTICWECMEAGQAAPRDAGTGIVPREAPVPCFTPLVITQKLVNVCLPLGRQPSKTLSNLTPTPRCSFLLLHLVTASTGHRRGPQQGNVKCRSLMKKRCQRGVTASLACATSCTDSMAHWKLPSR